MMKDPRITVLIPTRERAETLTATLKTCLEQNYDNLEIIVSDNDSKDETRDVVHGFNDARICYLNPGRRLSMTANFEFGLSYVKPGFVTSIGDDDGIMPNAIEKVAALLADSGVKAVASNSVYYAWPSFPVEAQRNHMLIRDTRSGVEVKNARSEVKALASFRGKERNYVWGMPTVYRGFVDTEIIDKAKRNGRYFHSVTPDAYSAFVNSFLIDNYLFVRDPLTLEGVAGKSNGASQLIGLNSAEESRYLQENDLPFHAGLSYAPVSSIILAECYLQARDIFPEYCVDHDFALERVCRAALREAAPSNRVRVQRAVDEILAKSRLNGSSGEVSLARKIANSLGRFTGVFHMCELDCTQFGVTDVFGASLLADFVLQFTRAAAVDRGVNLIAKKIVRKIKL